MHDDLTLKDVSTKWDFFNRGLIHKGQIAEMKERKRKRKRRRRKKEKKEGPRG